MSFDGMLHRFGLKLTTVVDPRWLPVNYLKRSLISRFAVSKSSRTEIGLKHHFTGSVLDMGMGCPEGLVGLNPAIQIHMSSALVRRAKLGFTSQGKNLVLEALARHQVPSVALLATRTVKRTQGDDGLQCESVKGLSPEIRHTRGC